MGSTTEGSRCSLEYGKEGQSSENTLLEAQSSSDRTAGHKDVSYNLVLQFGYSDKTLIHGNFHLGTTVQHVLVH